MKCLVTGAAGFIGSTLSDRLLADGHSVVGVDCFLDYYDRAAKERNLEAALKHPHFSFVERDLSVDPLEEFVSGTEVVFHQAGQPGVRKSWGAYFETYVRHNIQLTQRLLEAFKGSSSLQRFVYASSSSVYGDAEQYPTSESVLPRPVSPYGVTKLGAEHLAVLYASQFDVPTVSLRYFTVFGPRQRPDMAFHRFIRAGLEHNSITVFGDGLQSRNFTYVDDIVEANIRAATATVPAGSVYNIGGGNQVTVNEVLEVIRAEIGDLDVRHEGRQIGDARKTSADVSRARAELGFTPKISLHDGIRAEIDWFRRILNA